ncbi:hypothetical protein [Streptomyces erythrochromogenes]|uniref:hypothetical protein n=1 Tax=Streptomyces erythrochromogenes TaxID=285574 RepID=UPI0038681239|nr:hypothetical protein OG364_29485 [Streptomyces erythrochromogenes]
MPDSRSRTWMSADAYLRMVGEDWATTRFTRPGENLTSRRPGSAGQDGDAFDEVAEEAAAAARERRASAPPRRATMRPVKSRQR